MPRKSITSASVVPTTSKDSSEIISDNRHDSFGQTDEVIHQTNANQDTIDAADSAPTVAGKSSQQYPYGSLPVSQSLRMNVALTRRGSFKLVNNYSALATNFKQLQPFARRPDGTYPATTLCVLCATTKPTSVFFPCQHMCVCNSCIESNDMSPDCSMHLEQCVCPVCSADIGLILPHTGTEEDAYWTWALNSNKPSLPSQFTKDFQNAGKKIADTSIQQTGLIPTRRSSDTDKSSQNVLKPKLRRSCCQWRGRRTNN
ncbi:Hypothetical protein PHPALM_1755 [Phytophthora palmivora]|uniref:RING-type domain-containing protein n=1 Tax=Phytophthora palmivora TaxID=4796 RepID=A0A2P4YRJ0_9STRA|nr:Hypothetical protein PHPALM_1755 [Phytophthora palmivora]